MQMNIRVVSEEEFNKWMAEQKTFKEDVAPDETAEVSSEVGMEISMIEQ